jgi:diguanylate cyclase (GGDEF)-like protein
MVSAARLLPSAARRELSTNATVWRMTGAFLWLVAAAVGIGAVAEMGYDPAWLAALGGSLLASGLYFFVRRPPAPGTLSSHISLALIWLNTALGVAALGADGSAAMGATLFLGPVTAMRCPRRLDVVVHIALASAAFVGATFLGDSTPASRAVVLSTLPALWLIAGAGIRAFELIDAQADALASLARRDALTGLGNRRMLDETLTRELARHERRSHTCSIVTLDLDGFKALNDRDGHAAGDALLAAVGVALQELLRAQDTAVRQGGDEFLVLLPQTDARGAERVALVIRERIITLGRPHGVGASMGTATFPDDGREPDHLLDAADARLRTAKGRRGEQIMAPAPAPSRLADDVTRQLELGGRGRRTQPGVVPFARELLATDGFDWWVFGSLRIIGALLVAACAVGPASDHQTAALTLAGALLLLGGATILRPPARLERVMSHLSLGLAWGGAIAAAVTLQPAGGAAAAVGIAVGQFLAMRVRTMRRLAIHLAPASVVGLAAMVFGGIDRATILLLLLMIGAWWEIAAASVVVFNAAERQAKALERLMHRDPLTGVGNRRMLDERLDQELARHRRTGESLAVVVLDLDGFKAVNDEIGHAAGDVLLRGIAQGLLDVVRASDVVARHGGDEFCIVAPETSPADAERLAGQIATRVAATASDGRQLSTSVGWATFPHDGATAARLLGAADDRLLAAKAQRPDLDWR